MIEIYKQPQLSKFRQIGIGLSVLFLIACFYILIFEKSNGYLLFTLIYPILMFLEIYNDQYYPYITLTKDTLTKRLFFKKYKIQLDEIECIKNVFGDIHVKGPDKIIQIEKDVVHSVDLQRLVDELKSRTALKPV